MSEHYHLTFTIEDLPIPPSTNHLYANKLGGGRYITKRYAAWRATATSHMMAAERPRETMISWAELDIRVNPKKRGNVKDDITNRVKPLEDFLVRGGIMQDDSIVMKCTITRDPLLPVDTCTIAVIGR